MILDVLLWVAVADAVAAVLLAGAVYMIGRRTPEPVSMRRAVGLAVMLTLPAVLLYLGAWFLMRIS